MRKREGGLKRISEAEGGREGGREGEEVWRGGVFAAEIHAAL